MNMSEANLTVFPRVALAATYLLGSGALVSCVPVEQGPRPACVITIDEAELARRTTIINAIGEQFPRVGKIPSEAELDLIRDQVMAEYGLHKPDTTKLKEDLAGAATVEEKVAILSAFTQETYRIQETYGFSVSAIIDPQNVEQTSIDVDTLVAALENQPVETIQLERTSEVVLGSPEPGKIQIDNGDGTITFAAAFSAPDPDRPGWRKLVFGPGNVGVRGHEGGHNADFRYISMVCGQNQSVDDAAFASANPEGFQYQDPPTGWYRNEGWQGATLGPHGASSPAEDKAGFYQVMLATGLNENFFVACTNAQKPVHAEKMAIISMRMDELDPNLRTGSYTIAVLGRLCAAVTPR